MTIGLKEHLYMIINCYVREMSYGDVKDFKEEFLEYVGNKNYKVSSSMYDVGEERRPSSYM